ncbi:MAG: hypothetical protein ACRDRI_16780 [Pseudonocardiaceae bacterium]
MQEALDSYLRDLGEDEITVLLEFEGTLGECDEVELRARIEAARGIWWAS